MRTPFAATFVLIWALHSGLAQAQVQSVTLQNPRFTPEGGAIEMISSTPISGGRRGILRADVTFQSDLVDEQGSYYARDLAVLWRVQDSAGNNILVGGSAVGSEWNGVTPRVTFHVDSVNVQTGATQATLVVPVGGYATRQPGRFPLLPDGNTSLTVYFGWSDRIGVQGGQPSSALAVGSLNFQTAWQAVWLGNEAPQGSVQLGDSTFPFTLSLRNGATSVARTFTIRSQPPNIVTVVDSAVTVAVGEGYKSIRVRADRVGAYRLLVYEGTQLVAQSGFESVTPTLIMVPTGGATQGTMMTSGGQQAATRGWDLWPFDEDERCVPGSMAGGPSQPSIEWCFPCAPPPNPAPTCTGEGGGAVTFMADAYCTDGDDECQIVAGPALAYTYRFAGKAQRDCDTITTFAQILPWGVGFGGSTTVTRTAWCCTYNYDSSVPPGSTSLGVCN